MRMPHHNHQTLKIGQRLRTLQQRIGTSKNKSGPK